MLVSVFLASGVFISSAVVLFVRNALSRSVAPVLSHCKPKLLTL